MKTKPFLLLPATLGLIATSAPMAAKADEQHMNLFPTQRAAHQAKMDAHAAHYESRGKAFVDNLYATGAETSFQPDSSTDDFELNAATASTKDVVDIVKQAEQKGVVPQVEATTKADGTPTVATTPPTAAPAATGETGTAAPLPATTSAAAPTPAPTPAPTATPSLASPSAPTPAPTLVPTPIPAPSSPAVPSPSKKL